jgi:hypothetical protein
MNRVRYESTPPTKKAEKKIRTKHNPNLSLSSPPEGMWKFASSSHTSNSIYATHLSNSDNNNNNNDNNHKMDFSQEGEGAQKAPIIYDLHLKPIDPYHQPIFPTLKINYQPEIEKLEILSNQFHHRQCHQKHRSSEDDEEEFQMPILVEYDGEDSMTMIY